MHVTKRDGLRTITFTEQEFDVLHNGFNSAMAMMEYAEAMKRGEGDSEIDDADDMLFKAIEMFALDDSDLQHLIT